MPNLISYLFLILWPVVAFCLYRLQSFIPATIWTILGAQLLLPASLSIKFEKIPQLDKASVPSLCVLLGCIVAGKIPRWFGKSRLINALLLAYVVSPIVTSQLNSDILVFGDRIIPGVSLYDAISAAITALIALVPFVVARQAFQKASANEEILRALVAAMLIYSVPVLLEIRFSPQFHNWIYGYHPSDFIQSVRADGFRPMVLVGHGLQLALLIMMAVVAAVALWQAKLLVFKSSCGKFAGYLFTVLLVCKSLGAAVYGVVAVPALVLTKPTFQTKLAALIVSLGLLYPTLRLFNAFPTDTLIRAAESISTERADSLAFRFANEDNLLARASERFAFGWGRYGRSRIYDQATGKDVSITDGRWIITLGQFGAIGFLSEFGLLSLAVYRAASAIRYVRTRSEGICLAALSLLVSMNIVDLLPNSGLVPLFWLTAGALLGRSEAILRISQNPVHVAERGH